MRRKSAGRIVRAIADLLWERDLRQMRAMDKLLAGAGPPPGSRKVRRPDARRKRP
jgi:hypothetical protein